MEPSWVSTRTRMEINFTRKVLYWGEKCGGTRTKASAPVSFITNLLTKVLFGPTYSYVNLMKIAFNEFVLEMSIYVVV